MNIYWGIYDRINFSLKDGIKDEIHYEEAKCSNNINSPQLSKDMGEWEIIWKVE